MSTITSTTTQSVTLTFESIQVAPALQTSVGELFNLQSKLEDKYGTIAKLVASEAATHGYDRETANLLLRKAYAQQYAKASKIEMTDPKVAEHEKTKRPERARILNLAFPTAEGAVELAKPEAKALNFYDRQKVATGKLTVEQAIAAKSAPKAAPAAVTPTAAGEPTATPPATATNVSPLERYEAGLILMRKAALEAGLEASAIIAALERESAAVKALPAKA